ncbi:MAG: tetratricopeptide repeat protein [Myxococcales bacterium]|nr:tetratricopeptide repeat protein [Myxococcales bacterium]
MFELSIDRSRLKALLLAALLVGMVVAAYGPALRAGFIWDDDDYVTENPLLHTPDGFERIWLSMDAPSQYFPLVYTAFRIEYGLWGLDPFGYHLINVLFHAANALLLWLLLRRLEIAGAWFAAAVFALHPVQVESVAWITERKNVMSLFFSLASLLAWLRFAEPRGGSGRRFYLASLIFYALALSSKVTACTLPAVQLLLLWLRGQSIDRRRIAQVMPFFALGVSMGLVITYWERHHIGTVGDRFSISFIESFLIATRASWFYLGKLLWPTQLTFSYPKFEIDPSDPLQYVWAIVGAVLLWALWRGRSEIGRAPLAAAIFFVATLSPVLGFIPLFTFWYTYVADHYQYMASIGPIALVAAGGTRLFRDHTRLGMGAAASAAALVLLVLAVLVWNQSRVYENEETLWRDTIAKNPTSWMAHTNLGRTLRREERFEEAVDAYQRVFAIKPDAYRAHVGRASALMKLGREREAEEHFEAALELRPDLYSAHQALARLCRKRGERAAAIAHYQAMIAIAPGNLTGHFLMGSALEAAGRRRAALAHYRNALAIDPDHKEARRAVERIEGARANPSARSRGGERSSPP